MKLGVMSAGLAAMGWEKALVIVRRSGSKPSSCRSAATPASRSLT